VQKTKIVYVDRRVVLDWLFGDRREPFVVHDEGSQYVRRHLDSFICLPVTLGNEKFKIDKSGLKKVLDK